MLIETQKPDEEDEEKLIPYEQHREAMRLLAEAHTKRVEELKQKHDAEAALFRVLLQNRLHECTRERERIEQLGKRLLEKEAYILLLRRASTCKNCLGGQIDTHLSSVLSPFGKFSYLRRDRLRKPAWFTETRHNEADNDKEEK